MAECNNPSLPFVYDSPGEARDIIREVSSSATHGVAETSRGNQFNAKDRADQDRYLAGEFRGLGVQAAQFEARLQKDRTDASEWANERSRDLSKDVERNGRSAELAGEKQHAAVMLKLAENAAAAALCCCETEARIAASTATILAALKADQIDTLRQQLTVFQVRALPGTGSSPV